MSRRSCAPRMPRLRILWPMRASQSSATGELRKACVGRVDCVRKSAMRRRGDLAGQEDDGWPSDGVHDPNATHRWSWGSGASRAGPGAGRSEPDHSGAV
jgi:hypothetical protein